MQKKNQLIIPKGFKKEAVVNFLIRNLPSEIINNFLFPASGENLSIRLTALEELGKAYIILSHFSELDPKKLKKKLMDHEQKRTLMIFDGFKHKIKDLNLPKDYLQQIHESGESYELWMGKKLNRRLKIWDKRNYGIYVSLNELATNWIIPTNFSKQDSELLLKVLDDQFQGYKNTLEFLKRRMLL